MFSDDQDSWVYTKYSSLAYRSRMRDALMHADLHAVEAKSYRAANMEAVGRGYDHEAQRFRSHARAGVGVTVVAHQNEELWVK